MKNIIKFYYSTIRETYQELKYGLNLKGFMLFKSMLYAFKLNNRVLIGLIKDYVKGGKNLK